MHSKIRKTAKTKISDNIYNAWLYVNDREAWINYVTIFASIIGSLFGSLFGLAYFIRNQYGFSVTLVSWISGILLMVSTAMSINKYFRYKWKDAETYDSELKKSIKKTDLKVNRICE